MRYQCSYPACELATYSHYCREHRATVDERFTCLFCKGEFDSLPFYGCCGACYNGNSTVRVLVDAATPQTAHGQEPYSAENRANVRVDGVSRWA